MFRKISTPVLLLLPAFVVLAAVVLLPLLLSLYSSFTPFRLTRPATLWVWAGFRNYERILSDGVFWAAFVRTIVLLTIALNLEMLLGLGLALLVNKATRGKRILRTIMMFPMMFSPVLVGFQFKFMFNDNVGLVNNALQSLGLTDQAIPWLIDGNLALFAIVVAEVWSSTSVFAILILAGLLAMPQEPVEAAKVDGCTAWQTFRYVTLPFVMPFAYIAMTIRSLDIARAYDIVKIMTDGGPARRTELIWTLVGRTAYSDAQMGLANAMAYVSILLSILFTVYFFRKLAAARTQIGAEW
ncbi:carbohydrate ABC transporter membrane protein 1 (CUT1 family) [Rhizobium sp. PP-F2F-G38]|uniref:Sugar ABC transporter permease n=1 Tax=Ferranicluibacter rubi TaxID=2715133 RepID=A0AA44CBQ0_9HYPH|nr:sugar ABC transporter permease [Ferranicluibacter rubi]PYE34108.1 carbohydrate ABC transporter membrane protein 1 (CUT1 family) [Rhizobium sp. PP-WC-1G-195]PYE96744.1 carbohydrate ABC transporter membrane protein 1 (CUT1 family) [Rhizobium sp. PP-F2F-G38]TCP86156.1 carbohydrate ABC transporter membrane protein 1 (CUT1 family) [Rhizobium sp. PP-CC-2G-626]TCQ06042.1 carbohydrate ABC transporter membrane protein 1 (CUT1 family) [Rhizobium sp. PP-F2F-G36]TCQ23571.1 carbohydrate ABC transporter 